MSRPEDTPGVSRRGFLTTSLAVAGAAVGTLSALEKPRAPRLAVRLGYAAITWGGRDDQAIDDIASLGFHGIQLRSSAYESYKERPAALKQRLDEKGLALLCFSSGDVDADPARRDELLARHVGHAQFVQALGGTFLQVVSRRPKERAPLPEEFDRLGKLLNDIGRRTLDVGVRLVYHNHMNGYGEAPGEIARILDESEPRYVSLLLDVAHYAQGGGDPVAAVARHARRLAVVHLKDVKGEAPAGRGPVREGYTFVELGQGRVDLPGAVAALAEAGYKGPALIELDAVADGAGTPLDAAARNKRYALEKLGLAL